MNPTDPLAQLHPLREPAAVAWWPPAPGWWLLSLMVLLGLGLCAAWLWRYRRRNRYRAEGMRMLQEVQARYVQDGDAARCRADINALLKSVALHAYPRSDAAALYGARWEAFLERTCSASASFAGATDAHYRRDNDAVDVDQLFRAASTWIRRHEVPR